MARLNEPPVSTDSIETLRRKFLRQNRDIARINSTQSLRIRALENECGRLLSENLDLRGQIIRLEKELDDSSAQRIADHAIEIKAKMEAQLIEWGSMLASLGLEPPMKRLSPSRRSIAKRRSSAVRSPPQRRLRDAAKDAEAAAQEGRLPAIHENKPYPRATMNTEQILALCSEAADTTDSPDLGPPPVSRFVDVEPVKVESPSRVTGDGVVEGKGKEVIKPATLEPAPPKLDFGKKPAIERPREEKEVDKVKATPEIVSKPVEIPTKTGSKRKFGDENDMAWSKSKAEKPTATDATPASAPIMREIQKKRSIKELSATRRELRDKAAAPLATAGQPRKALAAKSSNENLNSPRKAGKPVLPDLIKPARLEPSRDASSRDKPREKRALSPVNISTSLPPVPPSMAAILLDPETPIPDTPAAAPDTPVRPAIRDSARDTPPPADISSFGETSRPSRRAKPAISYAEPNLRDKMRRPTKELYDAVAGEGKFKGRQPGKSVEAELGSSTRIKEESDPAADVPAATPRVGIKESAREEGGRTSQAQVEPAKAPSPEVLPSSVTTERRKRASSRDSLALPGRVDSAGTIAVTESAESRADVAKGPGAKKFETDSDVYEFMSSSPASEPRDRLEDLDYDGDGASARPSSRQHGRRASAAPKVGGGGERPAKAGGGRKRASMMAPKKTPMLQGEEAQEGGDENDDEAAGASARDRISRRRSMML